MAEQGQSLHRGQGLAVRVIVSLFQDPDGNSEHRALGLTSRQYPTEEAFDKALEAVFQNVRTEIATWRVSITPEVIHEQTD